jgi:cytochrome P450
MSEQAAERMLATWPEDLAVPLHDHLRALTLEVILRTLTGHLGDPLDPTLALLHREVLEMLTITASPMFVESRLRHGPGKRVWTRFLDRRRRVDELLLTLIQSRTLRSLRGNAVRHDNVSTARDDVMSLILAGHETTAAQLAWAFQLLAHHPSVCDRLIREIHTESGDEYLTATIQEVLRHRCVFLFAIPRAVANPVEIGGLTYTPPTHLLACIYLLHHDPIIYPDPYSFRPERFLEVPPHSATWIPWGGGRKRCPGRHMAMLEMKVVLRTVLRERMPEAAARRMERPRWRSVIVTPHAGSRVVLAKYRH